MKLPVSETNAPVWRDITVISELPEPLKYLNNFIALWPVTLVLLVGVVLVLYGMGDGAEKINDVLKSKGMHITAVFASDIFVLA